MDIVTLNSETGQVLSFHDADVNLVTFSEKSNCWHERETDGRFIRKDFSPKALQRHSGRKADWDRQIELYGTVLWA